MTARLRRPAACEVPPEVCQVTEFCCRKTGKTLTEVQALHGWGLSAIDAVWTANASSGFAGYSFTLGSADLFSKRFCCPALSSSTSLFFSFRCDQDGQRGARLQSRYSRAVSPFKMIAVYQAVSDTVRLASRWLFFYGLWVLGFWHRAAKKADAGEPTIFDRIVAKQIPSAVLYEDDTALAFRDISPQVRLMPFLSTAVDSAVCRV